MASAAMRAGPVVRNGRPATTSDAAGSGSLPTRTAKKMPIAMIVRRTIAPASIGASLRPSSRFADVVDEAAVPGHAGANGSRMTGSGPAGGGAAGFGATSAGGGTSALGANSDAFVSAGFVSAAAGAGAFASGAGHSISGRASASLATSWSSVPSRSKWRTTSREASWMPRSHEPMPVAPRSSARDRRSLTLKQRAMQRRSSLGS